jgi:UDP-N-acetylmuramyl pentapeptide phosphotransferase/UDP-N-acetylglucosamine-1-phosphate transferase
MIIDFYKIIPLILISSVIYILNIKFFDFTYKRADIHQKYSSDFLGNPMGGYAIFFFVIFFKFYLNYLELFFLFSIFLSGILSDIKIFNSPAKRLFFQIVVILLSISFSEIGIISTRIDFLDYFLMNKYINIIFTVFCVLIVINGSNFIDGLNGLVIGYYSIISIILISINLNIDLHVESNLLINFAAVLIILLILNFFNKVFLGDNGSYLIGFLFSIFLIRIHQINPSISPYFIILLLWYPCFENLFSIIRKKLSKILVINPDNSHLHQLFFLFIFKRLNVKNKLLANNLTSLIINIYHFFIFFIGAQNFDKTKIQILLIVINLIVYLGLYFFLNRFKKNLNNKTHI